MSDDTLSLPNEIWKPVLGFEMYDVSNLGRVRSWNTNYGHSKRAEKPRLLKIQMNRYGYRCCVLQKEGRRHDFTVSRLVCITWHPKIEGKNIVLHNNGIRIDDRPENLRWGTCQENHADTIKHGKTTKGEKNPKAKLKEEDVRRILQSNLTARDLASIYSVCYSTIRQIKTGKIWCHVPAK